MNIIHTVLLIIQNNFPSVSSVFDDNLSTHSTIATSTTTPTRTPPKMVIGKVVSRYTGNVSQTNCSRSIINNGGEMKIGGDIQLGVEAVGDATFSQTNAVTKIENEKGELIIEGGFEDTRKLKPGEKINETDVTLEIVNK